MTRVCHWSRWPAPGLVFVLLMSCTPREVVTIDHPGWLSPDVEVVRVDNGALPKGRFSFQHETDVHGRLAEFRQQERLDDIVRGATSEFEQFLLLMEWTNSQWAVGMPDPYPPWNAFEILRDIRQGRTSGFCAQYSVVFVQACLALGCQARYVDLLDLLDDGRRTHFTVEVWSHDYQKWIILDPSYNIYYELNGVPMSAVELHMAGRSGAWRDIQVITGQSSRGLKLADLKTMVDDYDNFAIDLRNDHLSRPQRIWVQHGGLDWSDRYDYYAIWSTVPILVDPGYNAPSVVRLTLLYIWRSSPKCPSQGLSIQIPEGFGCDCPYNLELQ